MTQEAPNHYFQGVPSEMKICQTQVSPIGHTTTPSSMYIVPVLILPSLRLADRPFLLRRRS